MHFIALVKFRQKITKEGIAANVLRDETETKEGIRWGNIYWTLGRYDAVALFEAPDEKEAMKMSLRRGEEFEMEILIGVPVTEARKLVE